MYILINNKTNKYYIVQTKTALSNILKVNRSTIYRWFKSKITQKEYKIWTIIVPIVIKDARRK